MCVSVSVSVGSTSERAMCWCVGVLFWIESNIESRASEIENEWHTNDCARATVCVSVCMVSLCIAYAIYRALHTDIKLLLLLLRWKAVVDVVALFLWMNRPTNELNSCSYVSEEEGQLFACVIHYTTLCLVLALIYEIRCALLRLHLNGGKKRRFSLFWMNEMLEWNTQEIDIITVTVHTHYPIAIPFCNWCIVHSYIM